MGAENRSPLQAAMEARKRAQKLVTLPFLSDSAGDGTVAIRVPTVREEIRARLQAAQWLHQQSPGVPPEVLEQIDAASAYLVYDCVRAPRPKKADEPNSLETAFVTPDWLMQRCTPDEIGQLVGLLEEARDEFMARDGFDEDEALELRAALELLGEGACAELLGGKPKAWLVKFAGWMVRAEAQRTQLDQGGGAPPVGEQGEGVRPEG